MKKINRILVPTDFSENAQNAFRHALVLASKTKAAITVLHVVYPVVETYEMGVMVAQTTRAQIEAAKEAMTAFVNYGTTQVLDQLEVMPDIVTKVEMGTPISTINTLLEQEDYDLLVVGSKGKHDALDKVLGSVSRGLIEQDGCPVMVVPKMANLENFQTMAYATNFQKADPLEIWRATQLLDATTTILRVVHVDLEGKQNNDEKMRELETFFADHAPTLQITFHNLVGGAVDETLDSFVDNYDVNLLIMYRPKRSFVDSIFHRSQTKRVAEKIEVPLLVMK